MNKVLVLMATYNGEKYLDQQLESLFNQKDVDVEVLVRDDGSKDNTQTKLEEWHKKENLNWYTGEHLNVKYGFFDLMEHAAKTDYQYFAFCDQDDVWDADKLSVAISKLKEVKKDTLGLYYCGQRLVDENLNLLDTHELKGDRSNYARFMLNDAAGCTEVFNKALLDKIVSYKPNYLLMHDAWMVKVCLALGGTLIVDPNTHMSYRQHTGNAVGLKHDLKSNISRAKQYIREQDVQSQMIELYNGYSNEICNEYLEIVKQVINYKKSISNRIKLLNRKKFDFKNKGIQLTYTIKVLGNNL